MNHSKRILSLSPSPTVALNAKAKALKAEGHKVLNFGVGEPDYSTPNIIVEKAVEALNEGKTRYGPAGGSLEMRQAIADKIKRENNLEFDPNSIVVGMGAKEILFHLFLALLNDGDEVILLAPYWVSYTEQIKAAGAVPVIVPIPDYAARIATIAEIDKHVTSKTVGIVLNSPNNPAGNIIKKEELTELGEYIDKKGFWAISDEIYEYMAFDSEHVSLLEVCPQLKDRFFLVNGVSKSFAMTGWRLGWGAGPSDTMKLVKSLQSHSSTCVPPFVEAGAILAYEKGAPLMAKEVKALKARRDLSVKLLKEIDDVEFIPPEGAFYIFIDLRKCLKGTKYENDTLALGEFLLTKHYIAMVPGEAFGCAGFIRLSYATDEETIKEGLGRLKTALSEI